MANIFTFPPYPVHYRLLAGSYPALVLSGFKPITILRGVFRTSPKGVLLRKGLVIFQFSLSIALIAGTVIVVSQLDHLQNKNLGFKKNHMLVIDFNYDEQVLRQLESIKQAFLREKEVVSVSASRSVPGSYFPNAGTSIETENGNSVMEVPAIFEVDIDFIPHFGIEMAAGRPYSRDFPADTLHSLVINEATARLYGYSNPKDIIGKRFSQWGRDGTVIGVTKDFNYLSLHQRVEPLTLRLAPMASRFLSLQIQSDNLPATISKLGEIWTNLAPQRPYLYSFLDDSFNRQYEADIQFRNVFSIFSSMAIFIACLGLLGLATYTAQQRTKEIGVRKVLGASVNNIIKLLSTDFMNLVLIAGLISSPLAWFAMDQWLANFAYHMEIHWWIFVAATFLGLVIAFFTVSYQAIKAAMANPVKSLRSE
ncbi:ABC transporter permease [Olivibacter jilunii]|uniref:ABC transporter permease n=1 Tax=Olivibacter jilunii TaxID=985016 RepID=UPI003F13D3C4